MLAAAPAFLDRLDRGTPTVRRCELLAKHTRTADAEAVVRDVKTGIEAALGGGRFADPLLTLHLRRLLRLIVNEAALPALNAEAASHAAARSGMSSAAAAAAAPSVEAAIVSCIAALGAEKCTSPPLAGECATLMLTFLLVRAHMDPSRRELVLRLLSPPATLGVLVSLLRLSGVMGHFPLLLPCLRLLTLLYDRYASARIIARDRNVPGIVAELNRRYEAIPPSVSSAAIELMATMSQWIPRRHSPRRRRAEAEDAARAADGHAGDSGSGAAGSSSGGVGGEGSLDFAGSRRKQEMGPARALVKAYASPLASPLAPPTSRRTLGSSSPRFDGSFASGGGSSDGADTGTARGAGGSTGLVLSPIRANFKGLPAPLAGALSPTSPSARHGAGAGSPRLAVAAAAGGGARSFDSRPGRLPAHSPLRLRPIGGLAAGSHDSPSVFGSGSTAEGSAASIGDGSFEDGSGASTGAPVHAGHDGHDGHGHASARGHHHHRSSEAAAFAAAEEEAALAFGEDKFIDTMTARFGGGLVGAQRAPLPRSFPIDAPPRPQAVAEPEHHHDPQHQHHHDAYSYADESFVGGPPPGYGAGAHEQTYTQQGQQHYEVPNLGYGAPAAGARGMRGRGLLGGGADASGPL